MAGLHSAHFIRYIKYFFMFCIGIQQGYANNQPIDNWFATTAENYAGITLRGVTEDTAASHYVKNILIPAFEQETGIRIDLELASWEEMYDKSIRDLSQKNATYDFIYIEQDIVYAYLAQGFLVNLSQLLKQQPELASPQFSFKDFTSYLHFFRGSGTDDIYAIPFESFLKLYAYRRDLFEDPIISHAFQEKYGYPLKPARSIREFNDISVFFTEWGKKQGLALWGTTIQASPGHPASFYELFETILPSFGVYNWGINQDMSGATMKKGGTLNSPKAKKGFQFWLDLLPISPPESYGSTWHESALSFSSGRVAHGWLYGENIVPTATEPAQSVITGKVGVALPPLAPGVLEEAKKGKGYIGYYDGGAFGIPYSSQNKKAALLWLQYIGRPSIQTEWALATGRVVHRATLVDPKIRAKDPYLGNYFSVVREYGHLFSGAPPFAEHAALREVISPFIYQAIRGELSPSEALDLAAAAVDLMLEVPAK